MKTLKRTRENDRIAANLVVHRSIMVMYVAAGKSTKKASRLAMLDLQQVSMKDRITEANKIRSWTKTVQDGPGRCRTVPCFDHAFAWSGTMPCTGTYRCMHCGKPRDEESSK